MTLDDFANGAAQSKLLSYQEIADLFLYLTAKHKPKLWFPTTRRKGRMSCCRRFQTTKGSWGYYTGDPDSIQFSVDKAITVVGYGLYGSCRKGVEYQADISLEYNETILIKQQHKMVCDGSTKTVHVLFDYPAEIEAHTNYTAALRMKNQNSGHHGVGGMSAVSCGNVKFTFAHSSKSKNYT